MLPVRLIGWMHTVKNTKWPLRDVKTTKKRLHPTTNALFSISRSHLSPLLEKSTTIQRVKLVSFRLFSATLYHTTLCFRTSYPSPLEKRFRYHAAFLRCDTESAVTARWLSDIVPCETYNLILKYCMTAGVWEEGDGREETERWITNFWNWYGNPVTCSISACRLEVLELRNTRGTFRVLLTRINTAGAALAKCRSVFLWAFSVGHTGASFKVDFLPSCGKVSWKLLAFLTHLIFFDPESAC